MSEEPAAKRSRMVSSTSENGSKAAVIGTHNGHFHADEALAVFLLRQLSPYSESALIRTRDPEVLKHCDIVVDVGGVHDHSAKRYDHHQRGFNAVFPGKSTQLSSAGLVWMHYGKDIISAVTGLALDDPNTQLLHEKLYEDFVEAFDANDNGVSVYDPSALRAAGIDKKFLDKGFTIASVVNRYNHIRFTVPAEDRVQVDDPPPTGEADQAEENARFAKASRFVGEQFHGEIFDKVVSWLPARAIVQEAFAQRKQHDPQGRIIVIPWRAGGVPWSDHLYALENEEGVEGQVLYALFPESGESDSKWRIRAVSLEPGSFENRKSLPEAWRGVRDEKLSKLSGIPGCVFVHAGGFIGGNATFDGALEMAKKAVS